MDRNRLVIPLFEQRAVKVSDRNTILSQNFLIGGEYPFRILRKRPHPEIDEGQMVGVCGIE